MYGSAEDGEGVLRPLSSLIHTIVLFAAVIAVMAMFDEMRLATMRLAECNRGLTALESTRVRGGCL